jgi:UTP:GlnB (protein PII) uridylyltransferase
MQNLPTYHGAVLSNDDFDRIKRTLLEADAKTKGQTVLSNDQVLREHLRELSVTRSKKMGGTLEALRERKERRRLEKAEEEEARRQMQDAEEAVFQADQRRQVIERARKLLYEETDKVKALNSKALLSDAIKVTIFVLTPDPPRRSGSCRLRSRRRSCPARSATTRFGTIASSSGSSAWRRMRTGRRRS